jgi:hypothetical protein
MHRYRRAGRAGEHLTEALVAAMAWDRAACFNKQKPERLRADGTPPTAAVPLWRFVLASISSVRQTSCQRVIPVGLMMSSRIT